MRTGWDVLNWRPQVEYPQVDLNVWHVLEARYLAEITLDKELSQFKSLMLTGGYKWKHNQSPEADDRLRFFDVWHGTKVFRRADDNEIVTFFQLPWRAKSEWLIYIWKHPRRKIMTARASWANMLSCLGVQPSRELILRKQRADVIPTGMDAPMQSTTLRSIAVWCYLLGMKNVQFDTPNATIKARNKYANIVTTNQTVPGVANVISLEGDLDGLRRSIIQASTAELFEVITRAIGLLDFVAFRVSPNNYQPFNIVYALHSDWNIARVWIIRTTPTDVGNLIWEANKFEKPTSSKSTCF